MPVHQGISHRIWTQTLESKNNNFNNFKYYIHLSHRRYIQIKDFNNLPGTSNDVDNIHFSNMFYEHLCNPPILDREHYRYGF